VKMEVKEAKLLLVAFLTVLFSIHFLFVFASTRIKKKTPLFCWHWDFLIKAKPQRLPHREERLRKWKERYSYYGSGHLLEGLLGWKIRKGKGSLIKKIFLIRQRFIAVPYTSLPLFTQLVLHGRHPAETDLYMGKHTCTQEATYNTANWKQTIILYSV
jgi:hypothetical protein